MATGGGGGGISSHGNGRPSMIALGSVGSRPRKYTYDHVFDEAATQDEVYQTTTSPLIKDVLRGLSAAVFAYGSTGSGKTHTMLGSTPRKAAPAAANSGATPKGGGNAAAAAAATTSSGGGNGLMVKAIDEIFRHVESSVDPDAYRVSCGYYSIHVEFR